MAHRYQQFLCYCKSCNGSTSRKYAREHSGLCKMCFTGQSLQTPDPNAQDKTMCRYNEPTRNERMLESGYQAYAREEGHYDDLG
jgi:hypothetical protein